MAHEIYVVYREIGMLCCRSQDLAHEIGAGQGAGFQDAGERLLYLPPVPVAEFQIGLIIGFGRVAFRQINRKILAFLQRKRSQQLVIAFL